MKKIILRTTAFVALFSLVSVVNANNIEDDKLIKKFTKIDTNGDGFIDKAEAAPIKDGKFLRKFAKIDTNADGKISLEEAKAARDKRNAKVEAKRAAANN